MSNEIYHWQGPKNVIDEKISVEEKLGQISQFMEESLQGSNLCIFIASGCSSQEIPLASATMKELLEDDTVKENVELYTQSKDVKNFNEMEKFLNWLVDGYNYEREENRKKEIIEVIEKTKKALIDSMKKFGDTSYLSSKTAECYQEFYKYIFSKRSPKSGKIGIFTTNYDLFNEYALSNNGIRYTTGFSENILREFDINQFKYRCVDDINKYKEKWQVIGKEANLYKLHGSINWMWNDSQGLIETTNTNGGDFIIYPTELKQTETSKTPYALLFREFANQLQKPNTTLIVLGYGFPDEHINDVIAQNLKNDDFQLIVFGERSEGNVSKFYESNSSRQNFHLIGGTFGEDEKHAKVHHFQIITDRILKPFFEKNDSTKKTLDGYGIEDVENESTLELE